MPYGAWRVSRRARSGPDTRRQSPDAGRRPAAEYAGERRTLGSERARAEARPEDAAVSVLRRSRPCALGLPREPQVMAIRCERALRIPHAQVRGSQGLLAWLTTVDHKRIGVLYGVSAFFFLLVGGLEALVIRLQLAGPGQHIVSADFYNALFTMHGTTMV